MAAEDDALTLIVCEAFGNSIKKSDTPIEPADDVPSKNISASVSELSKRPGGSQFLALARVAIKIVGSVDAAFAMRTILQKTTPPENQHLIPHLEQVWQLLQRIQRDFAHETSPQEKGDLPPQIMNDSTNLGILRQTEAEFRLEKFIDALRKLHQVQLHTNASPQGKVDFKLKLGDIVITGEGDLGRFDVKIEDEDNAVEKLKAKFFELEERRYRLQAQTEQELQELQQMRNHDREATRKHKVEQLQQQLSKLKQMKVGYVSTEDTSSGQGSRV